MSDILTKKGRLALFENNIVIDKKLLKLRRATILPIVVLGEIIKTIYSHHSTPLSALAC